MGYQAESEYGKVDVNPFFPGQAVISVGYESGPFQINYLEYMGHIYLKEAAGGWVVTSLNLLILGRFPSQGPTEATSKAIKDWAGRFLADWMRANSEEVKAYHLGI